MKTLKLKKNQRHTDAAVQVRFIVMSSRRLEFSSLVRQPSGGMWRPSWRSLKSVDSQTGRDYDIAADFSNSFCVLVGGEFDVVTALLASVGRARPPLVIESRRATE